MHRRRSPLPGWTAAKAVWWGLWLLGGLGAGLLALYASTNSAPAWEAQVLRFVQGLAPPGLHQANLVLGAIGKEPTALVPPMAAVACLWVAKRRHLAGLLAVAASAKALAGVLKVVVDRPRPSGALAVGPSDFGGASFPSGHVLGTALLFGFLFYACFSLFPQRRLRLALQGICVAVVALMGVARMELGAHWPTDVLGGYLLAALVLAPLIWLHRSSLRPRLAGS